jgi:hypothetical protein
MKYVLANTQQICSLPEEKLENFVKFAKPTIIKNGNNVVVGYKHKNLIYRVAGGPLDYRTWRTLFHKSPKFRGLVYSLFSTFGKAQQAEASEIIGEILTDSEGNKATYWLLQKILGKYESVLSDEGFRKSFQSALQDFIKTNGAKVNTDNLQRALIVAGVPAPDAVKISSYFNTGKSQVVTVDDAIRMLNNVSHAFTPKFNEAKVEEMMIKAEQKMSTLKAVLDQMLMDANGKKPEEQAAIKADAVTSLVDTGLFSRPKATKYVDQVLPTGKKITPKTVQETVTPLSRPFVGNMMEPGTPYIEEYYKAFQDFVHQNPKHGPAIARAVAKNIFENPSGLPKTLTEHHYTPDFIKTKLDQEALKRISNENNGFIHTASKDNLISDINVNDDFQSQHGFNLDIVINSCREMIFNESISSLSYCHRFAKKSLGMPREAAMMGNMIKSMTDSMDKKITTFFHEIIDAFVSDQASALNPAVKNTNFFEETLKSGKHPIIYIIEMFGFNARNEIKELSKKPKYAKDRSHELAKRVVEKAVNMGKVGLGILAALGVLSMAGSAIGNLAHTNPIDMGNAVKLTMNTPAIPGIPMAPIAYTQKNGNIRLAQIDPLAGLEQETERRTMQIVQQYGKNPQQLQQQLGALSQWVIQQLQPYYDQIRKSSTIQDLSPSLSDELNAQLSFVKKMKQGIPQNG